MFNSQISTLNFFIEEATPNASNTRANMKYTKSIDVMSVKLKCLSSNQHKKVFVSFILVLVLDAFGVASTVKLCVGETLLLASA